MFLFWNLPKRYSGSIAMNFFNSASHLTCRVENAWKSPIFIFAIFDVKFSYSACRICQSFLWRFSLSNLHASKPSFSVNAFN